MRHLFFILGILAVPLLSEALSPAERSQKRLSTRYEVVRTTLSEVLEGGKILVMEDDSRWKIDPRDVNKTGGWLGPADIRIYPNAASSKYAYRIQNTWTYSTVNANRIDANEVD